ncbi:hypothetical protein B0T14DRAFT_313841 [Immersiella caudata]|uniref:Uncharacterized protein n=1 Tax=Immersiella caudata TaxID=314043 RepID=A0AA39U364_9PEZI|nr:hypothetical protein B0T14DRAFT_313841 [Immersiella caudata]
MLATDRTESIACSVSSAQHGGPVEIEIGHGVPGQLRYPAKVEWPYYLVGTPSARNEASVGQLSRAVPGWARSYHERGRSSANSSFRPLQINRPILPRVGRSCVALLCRNHSSNNGERDDLVILRCLEHTADFRGPSWLPRIPPGFTRDGTLWSIMFHKDAKLEEVVIVVDRADSSNTLSSSELDSPNKEFSDVPKWSQSQSYTGALPLPTIEAFIHSSAIAYLVCMAISIRFIVQHRQYLEENAPSQECQANESESLTMVESNFDINVAALQDLTFTQAKLIDLFWDIGVGQGGRLLHGWIFYHVACRTVTSILEYSALPYWLLIEILFRPDSLVSLHFLLLSLSKTHRSTGYLNLAFLAFGVAHVLFFGTLWSTATGYKSPVQDGYSMPDGSWVTRSSESLRICWNVDYERLSDKSGLHEDQGVVLGPTFGSLFRSFEELSPPDNMLGSFRESNGFWGRFNPTTASADFQNIYAYARTKYTLERFMVHYLLSLNSLDLTPKNNATWDANHPYCSRLGPKGFRVSLTRLATPRAGVRLRSRDGNSWETWR